MKLNTAPRIDAAGKRGLSVLHSRVHVLRLINKGVIYERG